jgi:hypothetical protein
MRLRHIVSSAETRILYDFQKNTQISNLVKIVPVGAQLFHADGRTDLTKLMLAFRNICERA